MGDRQISGYYFTGDLCCDEGVNNKQYPLEQRRVTNSYWGCQIMFDGEGEISRGSEGGLGDGQVERGRKDI